MNVTTEVGALLDNHPRRNNKICFYSILPSLTHQVGKHHVGEHLAHHVGKHLAGAVELKQNKYRGSFSVIYSLLPLAMSTCGEVGSDMHALINEFAIR